MAAQLSYFNFQTYKANAFKFLFCELYGCRLIEPFNSHKMTKTKFLLTTSIQYQADKWWEYSKITVRGLKVDTKFSKLESQELYGRQ